ncbi:MAG TPA: sugar ABC transporter substrate-binding protein, partial [Sphaerochaeta sp.]|nr:sugar ABC transporter substrate-binding protein [Sphaerochaeta sp.]
MRKPKKYLIALVIVSILSLSVLVAQGAKDAKADGPVELTIATWTSNPDQIALLNSFVEGFAKEKGMDIKANFESILFEEYNTKLSLELQGSGGPDLFWVLETA